MNESFLMEISTRDLENHDNLSLIEMTEENDTLVLTFKIQSDSDEENKYEVWKIECQDFKKRSIHGDYFNTFTILRDHALLWEHTQTNCSLYFKGTTENISGLIGELYLKHLDLTGGWIPFNEYINDMLDIRKLIGGRHGLFAEGPKNIMEVYSEVLNKFNISTSIISDRDLKYWDGYNWIMGPAPYSILIFGCSFVIAKEFRGEKIQ